MEIIIALAAFAFVTSVTPGPNNILLLGSGVRFGFWPTVPHILGIQVGFAFLLALCAYGIGILVINVPELALALKVFGTAYLLYLAWGLRSNIVKQNSNPTAKPFTFMQAALFQFVNPKAWLMCTTAGSVLVPDLDSKFWSVVVLCLVFNLIGTPSSGSWALIGAVIHRYLQDVFWQRVFSFSMVVITLYTAVAIWFY